MNPTMKKSLTLFLQAACVLIGWGALIFLLGEPHFEGRNAHATVFEIYFNDPFLAYAYVGSMPFFYALYRAFRLCGHARKNGAWSQVTVDGLRVIRRCALTVVGFVAGASFFIISLGDKEDRPAGVAMSLLVAGAAGTVAAVAARLARNLQNALRRSEGSWG